MIDTAKTVQDVLGDPASWPNVPDDFAPPSDSYILAKLASVVADGRAVHIHFWAGDTRCVNTLGARDHIEAELIVARLQPHLGDLLLEAINTNLTKEPN